MSESPSEEERTVELKVQLPHDLSWEEIRSIEDEISEAAGEILNSHGLERNSHHRIVEADYTSKQESE